MQDQFDQLIDTYLDNKIGIAPLFINKQLSMGLQQHIRELQKEDQMKEAGIGNDEIKDTNQKTRSDSIYWLDKKHGNAFETAFLEQADEFIDYLNRTCYTGINDSEFHYAVYEEGTYYKRHRDQFKNDNNRKYSLITYLNEDWLEEDGGHLLVYQQDAVQKINPESQTAVFFKSDEMEHEVSVSKRCRMSISGWLKQV